MGVERGTTNYTTLAAGLLSLAKSHLRVTYSEDDVLIQSHVAEAIDLFQRNTQFIVNPTDYVWSPDDTYEVLPVTTIDNALSGGSWWRVPICPVRTIVVKDAANLNVSTSYELFGNVDGTQYVQQYMYPLATVKGPVVVTLSAGYPTSADIPPALVGVLMRITAWLFENREMDFINGVDNKPYANSFLSSYWVPRC